MSHTKLGLAKLTVLAVFCAAGLGAAHTATAGGWLGGALNYHGHDGRNHYNISVGFNDHSSYRRGYYAPRYYGYSRPYYSSYVVRAPVYSYYSAPAYYTSYDPYDNGYYDSGYYGPGAYYGASYYPSSYYSVSYYGGSRGGWYGRDRDDRRHWNGGHGWNGHGDHHEGHDHDGHDHDHGHHP